MENYKYQVLPILKELGVDTSKIRNYSFDDGQVTGIIIAQIRDLKRQLQRERREKARFCSLYRQLHPSQGELF